MWESPHPAGSRRSPVLDRNLRRPKRGLRQAGSGVEQRVTLAGSTAARPCRSCGIDGPGQSLHRIAMAPYPWDRPSTSGSVT